MLPSEARIRIEGCCEEEEDASVSFALLVLVLRRGFWVRKTEPRAFWDVLVRRLDREEKNCFILLVRHLFLSG